MNIVTVHGGLNLGPLREKLVTNCWNLGAAAFMNRVQNRK
jgi:hypothetical protein